MAFTIDAGPSWSQAIKDIPIIVMERNVNVSKASDDRCDGQTHRGNDRSGQDDDSAGNRINAAESDLPGIPTTTKAGNIRQRMAWTDNMNKDVMRCYFKATKLETISTGYRYEFRKLFLEQYPHLEQHVSEQRLVDQKRTIIKNRRLTTLEIEKIKEEVARDPQLINNTPHAIEIQVQETIPHTIQSNTENHTSQAANQNTTTINHLELQLDLQMKEYLLIWENSNPTYRNPIPKLIYKKNTQNIIDTVNNKLIDKYINTTSTLEKIHLIVYIAALTIVTANKQELPDSTIIRHKRQTKPKWETRLHTKIENLRKDIGRITQYVKGNRSNKITKYIGKITHNTSQAIEEILDTRKQKLAVYSAWLKRYKESNERKITNTLFKNNEKQWYQRLMSHEKIKITTPPSVDDITRFWKQTWSEPVKHTPNTQWIKNEERQWMDTPEQETHTITTEELTQIIARTHNWKCPGCDHIQNFWYKQLTSTHKFITQQINRAVENPQIFPSFLTKGITYIKPKNRDTQNPANYRPITCLPTLYKIITAAITKKIDDHLTLNNILTEEQKGCRKNSKGCKEQLIIDSVIMKQAEKHQRNLQICYIDYKKAFDTVAHSWLRKVLKIYKINENIQKFLSIIMQTWKTKIILKTETETIETETIDIKRGIFQGDSLSALWFCLCLNPLSNTLNKTNYGFGIKTEKEAQHTINHLMYMDDIKLYSSTTTQMRGLMRTTEEITSDIKMEFGINKCKMLHIERGRWIQPPVKETLNEEEVDILEEQEEYRYLGFHQNRNINHTDIKNELKTQYKNRLVSILKSQLNSKNLTRAVNTFAMSILTYSFGVIKWSQTDLDNINTTTRTMLQKYRKLHPNSCIERVTLSRKMGGRGLIDVHSIHAKQIMTLRQYFHNKHNNLHTTIVKADHNFTPLNLSSKIHAHDSYHDKTYIQIKKRQWEEKKLHGKHCYDMQKDNISKTDTYKWLQKGQLFPETEGFVLAIQDQVIATRNYKKYIIKDTNMENDNCRKCGLQTETINHIIAGCKLLAGTDYTNRHNDAAKILHQAIAQKYGLINTYTPYYRYTPETIIENDKYKLYWDITIRTDKEIRANRPDIVLQDKTEKRTYLIDIAVPVDNNVTHKHNEKIDKYTPLKIEIQRIWKQRKVYILPFIVSATGITHTQFTYGLRTLELTQKTHELMQKSILLNTCTIVRKFMQIE